MTPSPANRPNRAARLGMGASFVAIGVLHFIAPRPFEAIIPEEIPAKRFWVYATGVMEVAGGVQLLRRP